MVALRSLVLPATIYTVVVVSFFLNQQVVDIFYR